MGRSIVGANILAGYNEDRQATNSDAQIGRISVKLDVIATNFVAGSIAGGDGYFGTADDAPIASVTNQPGIFSRIASIEIGGIVDGHAGTPNFYGFVANEIGSLRIHGAKVPLHPGPSNEGNLINIAASTFDVHVREI